MYKLTIFDIDGEELESVKFKEHPTVNNISQNVWADCYLHEREVKKLLLATGEDVFFSVEDDDYDFDGIYVTLELLE